jgi:hypothetical protein
MVAWLHAFLTLTLILLLQYWTEVEEASIII